MPFFRSHAHMDTPRREPWLHGAENTAIIRDIVRQRYTLLPFWYQVFYHSHTTGEPIMRWELRSSACRLCSFSLNPPVTRLLTFSCEGVAVSQEFEFTFQHDEHPEVTSCWEIISLVMCDTVTVCVVMSKSINMSMYNCVQCPSAKHFELKWTRVSSRMLWTEYPQDPATFAIDDEFLIGESQMRFFLLFDTFESTS